MQKHSINRIVLEKNYYKSWDLESLLPYKDLIEGMHILDNYNLDLLDKFEKIKNLNFGLTEKVKFDGSWTPNLERLDMTWSKYLTNMNKLTQLKELKLRYYKGKDLSFMKEMRSLEILWIYRTTVKIFTYEKFKPFKTHVYFWCSWNTIYRLP
jgi:hypothetical protein